MQQRLRLQQQLDVDLGGVEGHGLGAQDDVERRLVEQMNKTSSILLQQTQHKCVFFFKIYIIYLRVSLEGIPQLAVSLGAVLIGCTDN